MCLLNSVWTAEFPVVLFTMQITSLHPDLLDKSLPRRGRLFQQFWGSCRTGTRCPYQREGDSDLHGLVTGEPGDGYAFYLPGWLLRSAPGLGAGEASAPELRSPRGKPAQPRAGLGVLWSLCPGKAPGVGRLSSPPFHSAPDTWAHLLRALP